jgi:hypothetical protein
MSFRSAPADGSFPASNGVRADEAPRLDGEDALIWAKRVWTDRENWLRARGGVESVFMAAQLLGCREDAVLWLRSRTRV